MKKKRINVKAVTNRFFPLQYSDKQLKDLILKDVDNKEFENHCQEVANKLKIHPTVVKDLLIQNSFTVLSLLQKKALKSIEIKINITGYFSLVTSQIKYRLYQLKKKKNE